MLIRIYKYKTNFEFLDHLWKQLMNDVWILFEFGLILSKNGWHFKRVVRIEV